MISQGTSENANKRRWHRRHTMIDLAPLPRARAFGHARPRGLRHLRLRILPIAGTILFHDIGAPNQKASIDGVGALSRRWPAVCPNLPPLRKICCGDERL